LASFTLAKMWPQNICGHRPLFETRSLTYWAGAAGAGAAADGVPGAAGFATGFTTGLSSVGSLVACVKRATLLGCCCRSGRKGTKSGHVLPWCKICEWIYALPTLCVVNDFPVSFIVIENAMAAADERGVANAKSTPLIQWDRVATNKPTQQLERWMASAVDNTKKRKNGGILWPCTLA
jgi:hypothetical protein